MQTPFDDSNNQQSTLITGFVNFVLGNNNTHPQLEDFDLSEQKTPSDEIILKHLTPTPHNETLTPHDETLTPHDETLTPHNEILLSQGEILLSQGEILLSQEEIQQCVKNTN